MNASQMHFELSPLAKAGWTDNLRKGIWPKRMDVWLLVVYFAITIFRPWEKLIPELADVHFERICVVLMFCLTMLCGRVAATATAQTGLYLSFLALLWVSSLTAFDPELCKPALTALIAMFLFYIFAVSIVRTP